MEKNTFQIEAAGISKKFSGRASLFSNFSLSVKTGESIAITGSNGSGKSTLLKIFAGIIRPDKGTVQFKNSDMEISKENLYRYIGFSSPEINQYDELTGMENINFVLKNKNNFPEKLIHDLNLSEHIDKKVKFYSTGMKQRLKFISAICREPQALFLDEPGSNLDADGKKLIYEIIAKIKNNMLIIIATNEKHEADICSRVISLD